MFAFSKIKDFLMPETHYSNEWTLEKRGRYQYFDGILEKPQNDRCNYRLIKLVANDLSVLLVQDKQADTASAALSIGIGSNHDPADIQGLAHFVEHLVFMGTEKYPAENDFDGYLAAHSGYSNANTEADSTNYYFDVGHDYLEGALDRFAQMFISPLLTEASVSKEVDALDSEFKLNAQKDVWRITQLQRMLSNPNHPYSQFSIGNIQSLDKIPKKFNKDRRAEVVKFVKTYYSANVMNLCILGRESLDQLAEWATGKFGDIPNSNFEEPTFENCPPLTEDQLKKQVFFKPVGHGSSLKLYFPFPNQREVNTKKPGKYISHLLNHEGPGTIQAVLKKKGWVDSTGTDVNSLGPKHNIMNVYFDLTDEGLLHYREIIVAFFRYVNLIKKEGIQERLFKDVQDLSAMFFRFQEQVSAAGTTTFLARLMKQKYAHQRLLVGPHVPLEYDPALIKEHLGWVRPDNFSFIMSCATPPDGIEFIGCERWFGAEYNVIDFDKQLIELLDNLGEEEDFAIPSPNEYIPQNFDVERTMVFRRSTKPDLIKDSDLLRLWHKKDDTFWAPRVNVWLIIRTPLAYSSPLDSVKTRLYTDLVDDSLEQLTYDAKEAGLYYVVNNHPEGVSVFFGGYKEKLLLLVERLMHHIRNLHVNPDRFESVKNKLRQAYKNSALEEPREHASALMTYLTDYMIWTDKERLEAIDQVTAEDVQNFYPTLLSRCHVEALAHGNISKEDAKKMLNHTLDILHPVENLPVDQLPRDQSLLLPHGRRFIYRRDGDDPNNVNSAIEYMIQVCKITEVTLRNKLKLLRQLLYENFFSQLRTNEQLGYVVSCLYFEEAGSMGLDFSIQSERDPMFLESRIEAFLDTISDFVRDMTDETFKDHVKSLIANRKEKPSNLVEEGQRYWNEILTGYYDFEQPDQDIKELKMITKKDMLAFIDEYINLKSPTIRKISVHIVSQKLEKDNIDILYEFLVTEGISNLTIDDVRTAVDGNTKINDSVRANLHELLDEKCNVDSSQIDQLLSTIIKTSNNINEDKEVAGLSVGDNPSVNAFIRDVHEFKSKLTVNPMAQPVTDLIVIS